MFSTTRPTHHRFAIAAWMPCIVLVLCLPPLHAEESPDTSVKRPKYSPVLRQNEDWSVLPQLDPANSDFFDPIKHVPLSDDGSVWASFGGQARLRLESWHGFGFREGNIEAFNLTRLRAHADLHVGPNLRIFAEGKSAMSTDRRLPGMQRTLDNDELALQQLFGEVTVPLNEDVTFSVRGGRQMFVLGRQRLVSPLDWSNSMRAWDGVSGVLKGENWKVTGFWSHFVPVRKYHFNDTNRDEQFWGVYATGNCPDHQANLDLYYLGRDRDAIGETRHTIGGRLYGQCSQVTVDYDVEGAVQVGERGDTDIVAWMVAAELARNFDEISGRPRLWIGFDIASGDGDPNDSRLGTFDQLYPLGHAYLGYIDVIGRQNIIDLHGGVQVKPLDKLIVKLAGHLFWRENDDDALYNAGGAVVRPGGPVDNTYVGSEIDVLLIYNLDKHTKLTFGYSHFFPGSFVNNTGTGDDIDFFHTGVQFTF